MSASTSPSSFASVKLPSSLVDEARSAAGAQRRSVAGQIEYWATLGRIAEETGLTVVEAREAVARYDARGSGATALDAIEQRFLAAETDGTLAQAVRKTVQANRRKAGPARTRRVA